MPRIIIAKIVAWERLNGILFLRGVATLEKMPNVEDQASTYELHQLELAVIAFNHATKEAQPYRSKANELQAQSNVEHHNCFSTGATITLQSVIRKVKLFNVHTLILSRLFS